MEQATGIERWKQRSRKLKKNVFALYFAYKDPRVPWYTKFLAALVVTYAFSPIDLIPDFLPVIGYLDDLVLIPLGITVVLKMIPEPVMAEARMKAEKLSGKPRNWAAASFLLIVNSAWARAIICIFTRSIFSSSVNEDSVII
ncbi:MAG: YkvA family protein [Desulfitobacteriaceae bacterium]